MGVFNQKSKFKAPVPTIRKEVVAVEPPKPKPKLKHAPSSSSGSSSLRVNSRHVKAASRSPRLSPSFRKSTSPHTAAASSDESRKRKLGNGNHRPSPASDRVEFGDDSDTDDNWEDALDARKRRKRAMMNGHRRVDLNRKLAHPRLLEPPSEEGGDGADLAIIHAADVANLSLKCVPVLGASEEETPVTLQYPGMRERERYELVWGRDMIDAVKDIKQVVKYVAETYLNDDEAEPFLNHNTGLVRQLQRASSDKVKDLRAFKAALGEYNDRLRALHEDGSIAKDVAQKHDLPSHLVAFVLDQVYDRTVAPKVELLRKYENGSDNVYGELLHPFVTDILVERTRMTSDQVFVDLGSGVGNVVLQAALEIGCESWGCEMMENACNLAEAQKEEFAARCRLWGIAPGRVHLERGDFRVNTRVQGVLKQADVVLVNNQAFTSQLNDDLIRMFLDLKSGCKIISLKSFVHDHKSASHNINDVGSTILDVEDLTYPQGYVSWTGAGGTFCISTRK